VTRTVQVLCGNGSGSVLRARHACRGRSCWLDERVFPREGLEAAIPLGQGLPVAQHSTPEQEHRYSKDSLMKVSIAVGPGKVEVIDAPPRRTLDVGDQNRRDPRSSSRQRNGHPRAPWWCGTELPPRPS